MTDHTFKNLLFTDLVDSTQLAQKLGADKNIEVLARHDQVARDLLREFEGQEIKKSDGFLFGFESTLNAIRFAMAFHSALIDLSEEYNEVIACRAGIHYGEVFEKLNQESDVSLGAQRFEYEGLNVAVTGRVMSLARANQILMTASAFERVREDIAYIQKGGRVRWVEHGEYLLKGVENPVVVFEVGEEGIAPLLAPTESEKVRRLETGLPTILIMPFDNMLTDTEHDYFCEGLSDEIITDLSAIETVRVISRSASVQLKERNLTVDQIRQDIGAQYLLEGTARASASEIRVNVKLTNTKTGQLTWGERFRGKFDQIFEIQEEIARHVAEELKIRLTPAEEEKLAERAIPSLEAYQYYLRARQEIFKFTPEGLSKAIEYLEYGVEAIGDNVFILSALGYAEWQHFNIGLSTNEQHLERALDYAERCLALNPDAPDGYRLKGLVLIFMGEPASACQYLSMATDRNPNDTDALFWLIMMSGVVGATHVVDSYVERLLRIDPLTPLYQFVAGWPMLLDGRVDEAIEHIAKAHKLDPESHVISLVLGQAMAMSGETASAIEHLENLYKQAPDSFFAQLGEFLRLALLGDPHAAEFVSEDLEDFADNDPEWSWTIAQGYALTGDSATAVRWLDSSVDAGFINYPLLSQLDPLLKNARSHRKFGILMTKVKNRWSNFSLAG